MIDRKMNLKIATLLSMLTILFVIVLTQNEYLFIMSVREVIGTLFFVVAFFCMQMGYSRITYQDFELFQKRKKILYHLIDYFSLIISAILFLQLLFVFWFFPAIVSQTSMNPTLFEGDRVVIVHGNDHLERFDIVVFHVDRSALFGVYPSEDDGLWVKRVVGLPGEVIRFTDGLLYVNNQPVYEPFLYDELGRFYDKIYQDSNGITQSYSCYTHDFTSEEVMEIMGLEGEVIPEGYYLLLGDNRGNSKDSRMIGLVPESLIVGAGRFVINGLFQWERLGE